MNLSIVRGSKQRLPGPTERPKHGSSDPPCSTHTNAKQALESTAKHSSLRAEDFDAIFYTLGLGSAFDIAHHHACLALMEAMPCVSQPSLRQATVPALRLAYAG